MSAGVGGTHVLSAPRGIAGTALGALSSFPAICASGGFTFVFRGMCRIVGTRTRVEEEVGG